MYHLLDSWSLSSRIKGFAFRVVDIGETRSISNSPCIPSCCILLSGRLWYCCLNMAQNGLDGLQLRSCFLLLFRISCSNLEWLPVILSGPSFLIITLARVARPTPGRLSSRSRNFFSTAVATFDPRFEQLVATSPMPRVLDFVLFRLLW